MKKKTKAVMSGIIILAIIGTGTAWYVLKPEPTSDTPLTTNEMPEEQEVTVKINTGVQQPAVYEKIIDDTGEEVVAEVQRNEPIKAKPTKPPEKPKSSESYTNPDSPPAYTNEQTIVEEKPKQQTAQNAESDTGKVYVEGFGYVEQGSSTKTQTGQSTGDINKMVGRMD